MPAPDPEAKVCQCGRMADDLAQLMQVVNQRGVTEAQLAAVLVSPATVGLNYATATRSSDCRCCCEQNVTDFALWNIATAVSMNIDTGSHNCAPVDLPAPSLI